MSKKDQVVMQIYISEATRDRAKAVANSQGKTLKALILSLLARAGDQELKELIKKELEEQPRPGRPWK